jgi:hypothetical protein
MMLFGVKNKQNIDFCKIVRYSDCNGLTFLKGVFR